MRQTSSLKRGIDSWQPRYYKSCRAFLSVRYNISPQERSEVTEFGKTNFKNHERGINSVKYRLPKLLSKQKEFQGNLRKAYNYRILNELHFTDFWSLYRIWHFN